PRRPARRPLLRPVDLAPEHVEWLLWQMGRFVALRRRIPGQLAQPQQFELAQPLQFAQQFQPPFGRLPRPHGRRPLLTFPLPVHPGTRPIQSLVTGPDSPRRKDVPMAKQSIFGRIAQLAKANINALLDAAEDPAKMLDQMVRDYKNSISEAESAISETIGNL